MCGIAGIFLKHKALEPELGGLLAGMLITLCDRGPDSAGFAVYGNGTPGIIKLTLRLAKEFDLNSLLPRLSAAAAGTPLSPVLHDSHVVVSMPSAGEVAVRAEIEYRYLNSFGMADWSRGAGHLNVVPLLVLLAGTIFCLCAGSIRRNPAYRLFLV